MVKMKCTEFYQMAGRRPLKPEERKGYTGKKFPIFCIRVRERRIELGLTQEDLAKSTETKRPRISAIEAGSMISDCDRIIALARALETTPDYLFGFRDEP